MSCETTGAYQNDSLDAKGWGLRRGFERSLKGVYTLQREREARGRGDAIKLFESGDVQIEENLEIEFMLWL